MAAKGEQKNPIQVIERMTRLLEVLASHPEPLGLKQISQYTQLHPSTAHRILAAMSADRLVDRVEPGSYRLGMRLLELGNLVKSRISVRELALPGMRELHAQTRDDAGGLVAALSLSTPADRMKVQWGPLIKETADRISRTVGHRPSSRIGVA